MLKAVLFDVDGTIAETEELHRRAFNATFAELGLDLSWSQDEYRGLLRVTGGKERITAYFRARGVEMPAEEVAGIHGRKTEIYVDDLTAGRITLRPGVLRLWTQLREEGVPMGIATTTTEANVDSLLAPVLGPQWRGHFACIVAGDQVPKKKPAPDVYLACLDRLGIAASEAVAIEDSQGGIGAARAAGIPVVVTPSSYTDQDDFSCADCVLPSLGDPEQPWDAAQPGFPRRWVDLEDLRRIVAQAGQG